MKIADYEAHDGLGLAKLLRAGEVAPHELMEIAIELAKARGEPLNAICFPRYEAALEEARGAALKGRFGALPFLLKDSGLAARRLSSSIGSRFFAGMTSQVDSAMVERLVADGFLPFARTTVPEFCMAPTTEAKANGGPTRNPWDPTRSSGGSSGGAAVAVAQRIVPIAHASDGGGSIRIPASCCGVYGLKASRGLTPSGPLRGEGWAGLSVDGVLSLTVRDAAAALDGVAGEDLGAPYASPARPPSYLEGLDRPFARPLRIAKWTVAWEDIAIASDCLAAVEAASALLAGLGHEVIEAPPPPIKYGAFLESFIDVLAANVAVSVNGALRGGAKADPAMALEPAILDAYRIGQALGAEAYAVAINRFHALGRSFAAYMQDYDFILTPTLTQPPVRLGELSMDNDFRSFRRKAGRYTTFLAVINATGQPAASLPLHVSGEGLPIGVQLIGRFGAESELLRLSAHLETAAPWRDRRPPGLR